ncbi:hypothetical protein [Streptomyces subrutilus]|uniref:hypothetical protein n=1 Tax=Streptomyces subrutilus TaxID=36818 RepID=UPI0033FE61C2
MTADYETSSRAAILAPGRSRMWQPWHEWDSSALARCAPPLLAARAPGVQGAQPAGMRPSEQWANVMLDGSTGP